MFRYHFHFIYWFDTECVAAFEICDNEFEKLCANGMYALFSLFTRSNNKMKLKWEMDDQTK